MLYRLEPGPGLDRQLAQLHPHYPLLLKCWTAWEDRSWPRVFLGDEPHVPRVVLGGSADKFTAVGQPDAFTQVLADLRDGRFDPAAVWPDEAARARWAREDYPGVCLQLEGHGPAVHAAALAAGFTDLGDKDEGQGAYFYFISGAPRFSAEVVHPCRIVQGLELFELMCQGTDYDESGEYTRRCLEQGPSFVCEVGGEPVCWSCIHLSGALGMIYTPPRHRRRGYGRSLAAFQVDYMLQTVGLAWCAVLGNNIASQGMMNSLGANRLEGRMFWRHFGFPAESPVRQAGGG